MWWLWIGLANLVGAAGGREAKVLPGRSGIRLAVVTVFLIAGGGGFVVRIVASKLASASGSEPGVVGGWAG